MTRRVKAYTLIELLLVLCILAAMSVYGLSIVRSHVEASTLDVTSVEMQNWLVAEASYYIDHKKWPAAIEDMVTQTVDSSGSTQIYQGPYMDPAAVCSTWTVPQSTVSQCGNKAAYQRACPPEGCGPGKNQYYGIVLQMPDQKTANQLSARVPGSAVTTVQGGAYPAVAAYTPIPAEVTNHAMMSINKGDSSATPVDVKKGYIASAGVLKGDHDLDQGGMIILPHCEQGYEAHYIQIPLLQRTGQDSPGSDDQYDNDHFRVAMMHAGSASLLYTSGNTPYVKAWNGGAMTDYEETEDGDDAGGLKYNYYLTFCIPQGMWDSSGASYNVTDTSHDCLISDPENIFQCSLGDSSWTNDGMNAYCKSDVNPWGSKYTSCCTCKRDNFDDYTQCNDVCP